jgi:hypothetical protein
MLGQRTLLYKGWIQIADLPRCCDTESVKTIVLRDNKVFFYRDEQPEAVAWRQRLPPLLQRMILGLPPFWFIEYDATAYTFTLVNGP